MEGGVRSGNVWVLWTTSRRHNERIWCDLMDDDIMTWRQFGYEHVRGNGHGMVGMVGMVGRRI